MTNLLARSRRSCFDVSSWKAFAGLPRLQTLFPILCSQICWISDQKIRSLWLHVAQAELVSIASKYSSVIPTLKVYFISSNKLLFRCTLGPLPNSLAICPVLHNIDGYGFTHWTPWTPEGFSPQKSVEFAVRNTPKVFERRKETEIEHFACQDKFSS